MFCNLSITLSLVADSVSFCISKRFLLTSNSAAGISCCLSCSILLSFSSSIFDFKLLDSVVASIILDWTFSTVVLRILAAFSLPVSSTCLRISSRPIYSTNRIKTDTTRPKITIVSGIATNTSPLVKFLSSSATAPIAAEPMLL